ncbi:hypothetical protein KXD40_006110 [Peronospora effusa]|uniref:Uncharacterized protein n=1 Tax=Peronospora effusa TaxID=542832 RepID=A0A3M6VUY6_9STRA|nr:hypothetical protein DD238_000675 [Peronospora effusa]RQM16547.1 hypothetical protein DD237_001069 [Peronospora effusa]UIZ26007.1 hypothetical protein KXD40_006110 [Peronospora effusa]CAI5706805.1 unnamed protein product [Peronospora effusa]
MSDDDKPTTDITLKDGDLDQQQQQAFLQQQLQQQQLQLLQLQQQQLQSLSQNMSPNELAALQQQQLALFMMPMFPLMMPLQQQALTSASTIPATNSDTSSEETSVEAAIASDEAVSIAAESAAAASSSTAGGEVSLSYSSASAESMGFTSSFGATDGFGLLSGTNTASLNMDEVPKRKRGRPPKKDVAARAKAEAEKTLKQQFPMWGYGLPMPLLPGFSGMLPGMSNPGAVVKDHCASDDRIIKEENEDVERPVKVAKKKQRGTGKPRGRPRTRPRPGEIIRRVKPLPIAPASYSVMYNYSLSNLAQRSMELNADGTMANTETSTISDEAQDEDRLVPLSASLLSGEHE